MGYTPPPKNDLTHYVGLTDAVHLGYGSYQTLRGHIRSGALPAVKISGRWKVLRQDLDALSVKQVPRTVHAQLDDYVRRIVKFAPELTAAQVATLRTVIGGVSA